MYTLLLSHSIDQIQQKSFIDFHFALIPTIWLITWLQKGFLWYNYLQKKERKKITNFLKGGTD